MSRPPNPRIVIVSTGADPWYDATADDLAARLHQRGWWVDRPDLADLDRSRTGRLGLRAAATVRGSASGRVVDVALARTTRRLAERIGEAPHTLVGVHPLVDRVLCGLRGTCASAPVVGYLAGPDVRHVCRAGGADVVLSPHPGVDRMLAALPHTPPLVPVRSVSVGAPTGTVRGTARLRVVVPAGGTGARRIAEVVRDLATWGVWPLVLCATNGAAARAVDALGVGTSLVGEEDALPTLAGADLVVDPTGGPAGWPAVLLGRRVVTYRVPRPAEPAATDLHDAGVAAWARDRTDLGLALAEATDPAPTVVAAAVRDDPAQAIEAFVLAARPTC